jgi:hypothetical protein
VENTDFNEAPESQAAEKMQNFLAAFQPARVEDWKRVLADKPAVFKSNRERGQTNPPLSPETPTTSDES